MRPLVPVRLASKLGRLFFKSSKEFLIIEELKYGFSKSLLFTRLNTNHATGVVAPQGGEIEGNSRKAAGHGFHWRNRASVVSRWMNEYPTCLENFQFLLPISKAKEDDLVLQLQQIDFLP